MYKVKSKKGEIFFVTDGKETYGFTLRGKEVFPITGDAHGFKHADTKDAIEQYKASHPWIPRFGGVIFLYVFL